MIHIVAGCAELGYQLFCVACIHFAFLMTVSSQHE
jgi:hypothetical protein